MANGIISFVSCFRRIRSSISFSSEAKNVIFGRYLCYRSLSPRQFSLLLFPFKNHAGAFNVRSYLRMSVLIDIGLLHSIDSWKGKGVIYFLSQLYIRKYLISNLFVVWHISHWLYAGLLRWSLRVERHAVSIINQGR